MKAVCWMGTSKVETLTVADPHLLNPHDAIIKITRTTICGSDLHLYDGFIPIDNGNDCVKTKVCPPLCSVVCGSRVGTNNFLFRLKGLCSDCGGSVKGARSVRGVAHP
jgi:hypothetical protein